MEVLVVICLTCLGLVKDSGISFCVLLMFTLNCLVVCLALAGKVLVEKQPHCACWGLVREKGAISVY